MTTIKRLLLFFMVIFLMIPLSAYGKDKDKPARGVWVTCFSAKRVLYSKEAAFELIKFCKKKGLNEVYLQFYRSGKAYYDTKLGDRSRYEEMLKAAGVDIIDFLLKEAKRCNVKVFAWVNVLCVGKNKHADIIKKFGDSVLTRDQRFRVSMRTEDVDESDKYYLRDDQLFLEPGDQRVGEYMIAVIDDIIDRYPDLSGVHLDYVRYPYPVPFLPRSSFNRYGLTYGYGEENVKRFKEKTNSNPLSMPNTNENSLIWDDWKRDQVTNIVEQLARHIKDKVSRMLVSCAVLPSLDTAFSAAFQDWPKWLENGMVDYVVLMNYTKNNQLTKEITRSALAQRGKGRVYIGIGNFLMKHEPHILSEQEKIIESLNPDGVAFFSYDSLL